MKFRFRSLQMERAVDLVDENEKDIYSSDVLTSLKCWRQIWRDLSDSVITNCWGHTGLLKYPKSSSHVMVLSIVCNPVCEQIKVEGEENIARLVPFRCRMGISEPFNPAVENGCIEFATDDVLVSEVVGKNAVAEVYEGYLSD